jgi:hypothetical protein
MSARLAGRIFLVVMGLGLLVGCSAHEGQKVVGYSGRTNNWVKVRDPGQYALRGADGHNVTYYVQKDERIGFRRTSEGTVEAFAGDNGPVELDPSTARQAYWKFARSDKDSSRAKK